MGEKRADVIEMKKKLKSLGIRSTDVQIFTPTPGTLSTAIYYAECDLSFRAIPVERAAGELLERKKSLTPGRGIPILSSVVNLKCQHLTPNKTGRFSHDP